jgi:hypothetical protein
MMMMRRALAASGCTAVALTAGTVLAPPANAAGPLVTGGLVNVTVTDVIDDVTVVVQDINVSLGAALGVAAAICDVNVNVLARQLRTGGATCISDASGQTVDISQI